MLTKYIIYKYNHTQAAAWGGEEGEGREALLPPTSLTPRQQLSRILLRVLGIQGNEEGSLGCIHSLDGWQTRCPLYLSGQELLFCELAGVLSLPVHVG